MPKHTWGVRLRAIGAVAACSLALVACGGDKDGDTAPDAKGETASSSPDGDLGGLLSGEPDEEDRGDPAELIEALAGEPLVLDKGKGPRAQLAVELVEGQRAVSTMQMTMEMTFNGKSSPSMPMTMVVSTTAQDVTDEMTTIRATYDDLEVDETGMPPAVVAELESELMPSSARSEVSTTMVMKAGGRRVTTATDVDMTITTESD